MSENGSMLDQFERMEPIPASPEHEQIMRALGELITDVKWLRSRVESMEAGMSAALEQPTMQAMLRNFGIEFPSPPDK